MTALARVALWVRRGTWTSLLAFAAVALTLALFDAGRHAATDRELSVTPTVRPDLVAQVVADVEAQGLSCTSVPTLTSSVVFENLDGSVELVSFDDALKGAHDHAGWVRWYCAPLAS